MNDLNDPNFFSALRTAGLSRDEKSRMRALLRAHVAAHPPLPAFAALFFRHALGVSLAAVLLLAGGTSVLAHRSMPDDFLYPLKLAVNDRVELVVAGDEDAKLDAEISQMARMLRDEERAAANLFDEEEKEEEKEAEDRTKEEDDEDDELDDEDEEEIKDADDEEDSDDEDDLDDEDERDDEDEEEDSDDEDERDELDAELRAFEQELRNAEQDEFPED